MRRLLVVPVLVALASCAVPSRDNPNDPANAPGVVVQFAALPPGTACTPGGSWSPVQTVSRGRCLAVDLRSTQYPKGGPDRDTVYELTFARVHQDGTLEPIDTSATSPIAFSTSAGLFGLTHDFLLVVGSGGLAASATVTAHGGISDGQGQVLLTNEAPIALGPSARSFPAGGYPWAPGPTTFDVPLFDRGSFDPDGEDIVGWRWSRPDGTVLGTTPQLITTIPFGFGRYLFYLEVTDGTVWSRKRAVEVRVGPSNVWTGSDASGFRIERLDATRRTLNGTQVALNHWSAAYLDDGVSQAVAMLQDQQPNETIYLFPFPQILPSIAFVPGPTQGLLAGDPSRPAVWSATWNSSNPACVSRWDYDSNGPTLHRNDVLDGASACNDGDVAPPKAMTADDSGRVWVATASGVFAIENMTYVPAIPASEPVVAFAARPGHASAWGLAVGPNGTNPELVIFTSPTSAPQELPLTGSPSSLVWSNENELWLSIDGDLDLFDVTLLSGPNPSFSDAEELSVPLGADTISLTEDPLTGVVWAHLPAAYAEVDLEGHVDILPSGLPQDLALADPRGGLWFAKGQPNNAAPTRGWAPMDEGVVARAPQLLSSVIDSDEADGGLWMWIGPNTSLPNRPPALLRLTEDGAIQRTFTAVSEGGVTVPPANWNSIRMAPDGHALWVYKNDGTLWRYDMTVDPPASPGAILSGLSFFRPIAAAAPVGADDFLWAFQNNSVETITPAGAVTSRGTFGATETLFRAARSTKTNDLCLETQDTSNNVLLRTVSKSSAGGVITPLQTIATSLMIGVGAAGDDCWFSWAQNPFDANCANHQVILQERNAAAVIRTFTHPGQSFDSAKSDVTASAQDDGWAIVRDCSNETLVLHDHTSATQPYTETLNPADAAAFAPR